MRTWISQWFLSKNYFYFLKNNFKRNNHWKFCHHKSYLKPFLSYLPCIVCREHFSIIFDVKKCALCSIKYGTLLWKRSWCLSFCFSTYWTGGFDHRMIVRILQILTMKTMNPSAEWLLVSGISWLTFENQSHKTYFHQFFECHPKKCSLNG